jgi:preprotein translocase subunit SecG
VTIFLTVLHVMVCVVLVVVVLLQHGKGADIGAVFGGGASNTVFGSRGAGNFLTRLTTGAALIFMVTSLVLSYLANEGLSSGLFDEEAPPPGAAAPAPTPEEGGAPAEGAAPGGFEEVPAPEGSEAAAPTGEPEAKAPESAAPEAAAPTDEAKPAPAQEAPATP